MKVRIVPLEEILRLERRRLLWDRPIIEEDSEDGPEVSQLGEKQDYEKIDEKFAKTEDAGADDVIVKCECEDEPCNLSSYSNAGTGNAEPICGVSLDGHLRDAENSCFVSFLQEDYVNGSQGDSCQQHRNSMFPTVAECSLVGSRDLRLPASDDLVAGVVKVGYEQRDCVSTERKLPDLASLNTRVQDLGAIDGGNPEQRCNDNDRVFRRKKKHSQKDVRQHADVAGIQGGPGKPLHDLRFPGAATSSAFKNGDLPSEYSRFAKVAAAIEKNLKEPAVTAQKRKSGDSRVFDVVKKEKFGPTSMDVFHSRLHQPGRLSQYSPSGDVNPPVGLTVSPRSCDTQTADAAIFFPSDSVVRMNCPACNHVQKDKIDKYTQTMMRIWIDEDALGTIAQSVLNIPVTSVASMTTLTTVATVSTVTTTSSVLSTVNVTPVIGVASKPFRSLNAGAPSSRKTSFQSESDGQRSLMYLIHQELTDRFKRAKEKVQVSFETPKAIPIDDVEEVSITVLSKSHSLRETPNTDVINVTGFSSDDTGDLPSLEDEVLGTTPQDHTLQDCIGEEYEGTEFMSTQTESDVGQISPISTDETDTTCDDPAVQISRNLSVQHDLSGSSWKTYFDSDGSNSDDEDFVKVTRKVRFDLDNVAPRSQSVFEPSKYFPSSDLGLTYSALETVRANLNVIRQAFLPGSSFEFSQSDMSSSQVTPGDSFVRRDKLFAERYPSRMSGCADFLAGADFNMARRRDQSSEGLVRHRKMNTERLSVDSLFPGSPDSCEAGDSQCFVENGKNLDRMYVSNWVDTIESADSRDDSPDSGYKADSEKTFERHDKCHKCDCCQELESGGVSVVQYGDAQKSGACVRKLPFDFSEKSPPSCKSRNFGEHESTPCHNDKVYCTEPSKAFKCFVTPCDPRPSSGHLEAPSCMKLSAAQAHSTPNLSSLEHFLLLEKACDVVPTSSGLPVPSPRSSPEPQRSLYTIYENPEPAQEPPKPDQIVHFSLHENLLD